MPSAPEYVDPGPRARLQGARAAALFILVTVFLDSLCIGIIIPVLPRLLREMSGGGYGEAAGWLGLFSMVFGAAQFLCAPLQGALSDRFGRRAVVLISNLGMAANFVILALAPTFWLLLIGRVVVGITASSSATASAYVADTTCSEKRGASFGMLGGASVAGFISGPALGGILGDVDLRLPFWTAAALALINFLYGVFVLPESLAKEHRSTRLMLKHANPVGALSLLRQRANLLPLAAAMWLLVVADCVLLAVFVIYADYRFGWHARTIGLILLGLGCLQVVVRASLVGRTSAVFGERGAMLVGMTFGVVAFALAGIANTGWMFLSALVVLSLAGLATPPLQSMMTRKVSRSEQGRLQSALASLNGFAGMLGPFVFSQIFALSIGPGMWPGASGMVFLVAALFVLSGAAVATLATRDQEQRV